MAQKPPKSKRSAPDPAKLLAWYDRHRRVLPWRALPGQKADPYRVWLSEIMLQQTTVPAVGPYFQKFLQRWPTVQDLAAADLDEVLQMWAGLGYYRRARGLHACAQKIVREFDGAFPREETQLRALPGVGPYTAAAIAAIAFDQRANVVDGNVERVMARVYAVQTPMPKGKAALREKAAGLLPERRHGDYAQALMDLGATVCTPRSPKCDLCPWSEACVAFARGIQADLPRREKPNPKPLRRAYAFVLFDAAGRVQLRRRQDEGLLAGMMEVPSTAWEEGNWLSWPSARKKAPKVGRWRLLEGLVRHTFTHFELELRVAVATISERGPGSGWVAPDRLKEEALPSVMLKVLRLALESQPKES